MESCRYVLIERVVEVVYVCLPYYSQSIAVRLKDWQKPGIRVVCVK